MLIYGPVKKNKKTQEEQFKEKCAEEFKKIEEETKPLFVELKQQKQKLDWKKECKHLLCGGKKTSKGPFSRNICLKCSKEGK